MSAEPSISVEECEGFTTIRLSNRRITCTILPQIGGKMIELRNNITGTQFLLQPQSVQGYRQPHYGAVFDDYDTSGFDECFPTVEASPYRYRKGNRVLEVEFPDHGELWSREWQYHLHDSTLRLWIDGVRFPYRFEKTLQLQEDAVVIHYRLQNCGEVEFDYLWSAHPLLRVVPGAKILFRENIQEVLLNWSSDPELGDYGAVLPWPHLSRNSGSLDFSIVPPQSVGKAVKCFTPALSEGGVALHYPDRDEAIVFEFDPREIPYVGLWLCYGGWPMDSPRKHYTVALEPARGRPDSLQKAMQRQEHCRIAPGATDHWSLKIRLVRGGPLNE
ncbi:MAG: hypothetical protein GXO78_11795 [Calditrichaeota bacterium]|nr:hypothetical protein [Calditrichota bacterium]